MSAADPNRDALQTLIVGAGVAALEAAAALHALAEDLVAVRVLADDQQFTLRQTAVRDPFTDTTARSYPLEPLLSELGAERVVDRFKWVDAARHAVHTAAGETLRYDLLLLAMGARQRLRFHHAVTLFSNEIHARVQELITAIDAGRVTRVVFIVPSEPSWPLPLYELALLSATYAQQRGVQLRDTLITPEDAPLAILGETASNEVARVLAERGVRVLTRRQCQVRRPGRVSVHPSGTVLEADAVISLPELYGPSTPGIATTAVRGFISVESDGAVRGTPDVYAAGDATDRAVKHGSLAAEHADVVAATIAARAGAPVEPHPSRQSLHALLLGGGEPLFITAQMTGAHGVTTELGHAPLWHPPRKLYVPYLEPYLRAIDSTQVTA